MFPKITQKQINKQEQTNKKKHQGFTHDISNKQNYNITSMYDSKK